MKNEKSVPVSKVEKNGPSSNPKNKFKKGTKGLSDSNIVTSAVENVKAKSGHGLADEGTNVDYNEER